MFRPDRNPRRSIRQTPCPESLPERPVFRRSENGKFWKNAVSFRIGNANRSPGVTADEPRASVRPSPFVSRVAGNRSP